MEWKGREARARVATTMQRGRNHWKGENLQQRSAERLDLSCLQGNVCSRSDSDIEGGVRQI